DMSAHELYGERPIQKPLCISGTVRNSAGVLILEGEITAELELVCDRCMKHFRKEKRVPLHFLLAQELAGEEEDEIILLDGEELDIGDLAFTTFILDMDTKNLCSEDCKGLCPGCGANLNEEACRCKPEVDPRWATLSQLLDKTE
ncbi:MAG: hypothetical protein K0S60_324, partial [Evtepia sp.]|nr:hypothetical protein [Evtepia sp.]